MLASRINSIISQGDISCLEAIGRLGKTGVFTHVDLNYPEHFAQTNIDELKKVLDENNIKVNGIAVRFRKKFINGEFGNKNEKIVEEAITLSKDAIDTCVALGGDLVTVWLGYDGFDYSFQISYVETWNKVVSAFQGIASYNPDVKISIEYKPYEPRTFSLLPSIGTTLLMIQEINKHNMGITLDYCHMLMKRENPSYSLSLANKYTNIWGIHLNDGYGNFDDGLMVGSVSFVQTLEFIYYLKRYNYNGVIYFDTFPVREDAIEEAKKNAELLQFLTSIIDKLGLAYIESIIQKNDALAVQDLLLKFLKNKEGVR